MLNETDVQNQKGSDVITQALQHAVAAVPVVVGACLVLVFA